MERKLMKTRKARSRVAMTMMLQKICQVELRERTIEENPVKTWRARSGVRAFGASV
jgi:hypothetical protein